MKNVCVILSSGSFRKDTLNRRNLQDVPVVSLSILQTRTFTASDGTKNSQHVQYSFLTQIFPCWIKFLYLNCRQKVCLSILRVNSVRMVVLTSTKILAATFGSNSSHKGNRLIVNLPQFVLSKGQATLDTQGFSNVKLQYIYLQQETYHSNFLCSYLFCKYSLQLCKIF